MVEFIEVRFLRAVIALAEELSYSRAAKKVSIPSTEFEKADLRVGEATVLSHLPSETKACRAYRGWENLCAFMPAVLDTTSASR